MRRAALAVGGTVAGLAALFSFRTHAPGAAPVAAPGSPAATTQPTTREPAATNASAKPATEASAKPGTDTSAKPGTKAGPTPAKASSAPAKASSGQFEGPDVNTQYGPVQVVLSVSGGKVTGANDAQEPVDSIGATAIPQLNQEVLTTQSANVQTISGATFTSEGYKQSLQQAIDKAGI